jgi:serine/threonine protein kinase
MDTNFLLTHYRYVAPEYAGTGMLNETSDVYSFGILIMEIITGRVPVDYNRPPGEVSHDCLFGRCCFTCFLNG